MTNMKMVSRSLLLLAIFRTVLGHPMCLDYTSPTGRPGNFDLCTEFEEYGCCTKERDSELHEQYLSVLEKLPQGADSGCAEHVKDLLCQECSEYAAHQYALELNGVVSAFPGLCPNFCEDLHTNCSAALVAMTNDTQMLGLLREPDSSSFCEAVKLADFDYCFPHIEENDYLSRNLDFFQKRNQKPCMQLCVEEVANKIFSATSIRNAGDGSHRLFVVEQGGVIWAFMPNMSKIHPPFLNITESVACHINNYDERGLLDIQFHPEHRSNGLFYIYYTAIRDEKDIIRISEMKVTSFDINLGDPSTERIILEAEQPFHNHNGGQLLFGKDGYLYIFTGDGGGAGDKAGNGQNRSSLLGKVLRIDINSSETNDLQQYTIPADNPYVNMSGILPEIYAYGLRNPWRCTLDPKDRMICGDVGQETWEEVDVIRKGGNYGWRGLEGNHCYDEEACEEVSGLDDYVPPIFEYNNTVGKSITGGHVYRGCQNPKLKGQYIFADFMSGTMMLLKERKDGSWGKKNVCMSKKLCRKAGKTHKYPRYVACYGEDESGELYFASTKYPRVGYGGGSIFKLSQARRGKASSECRSEAAAPVRLGEASWISNFQPTKGQDVSVRLVGANEVRVTTKGRVEIRNGRKAWGTVCGENWSVEDGHVICRMMGFVGARNASAGAFGPGLGPVRFRQLGCSGKEDNVEECDHSGWQSIHCPHAKDAAVWCETYLFD